MSATDENQPGVTDESLLVIEIGEKSAGGGGQLLLDDVEFSESRDNTMVHGIGNVAPQGVQRGNVEYEVSATAHFNDAAATIAKSLTPQSTLTGKLYFNADGEGATSDFKVNYTKLDWNDVSIEASDDGDVTMSVDFDARVPSGKFSPNEDSSGGGSDE